MDTTAQVLTKQFSLPELGCILYGKEWAKATNSGTFHFPDMAELISAFSHPTSITTRKKLAQAQAEVDRRKAANAHKIKPEARKRSLEARRRLRLREIGMLKASTDSLWRYTEGKAEGWDAEDTLLELLKHPERYEFKPKRPVLNKKGKMRRRYLDLERAAIKELNR